MLLNRGRQRPGFLGSRPVFSRRVADMPPPLPPEPGYDRDMPPMPGPISGYAGGTWNLDGSQATPVQRAPMEDVSPHASPTVQPQGAGAAQPGTIFGDRPTHAQGGGKPGLLGAGAPPSSPLGISLREPFDYEGALTRMVGERPKVKDWQRIVAVLGDALVSMDGGQPWASRSLMSRQGEYDERARKGAETILGWQHQDWSRQNEADLRAANPFSIGRDRLSYNPATGQTDTLYDGQEDFELYAAELGLEPGSEEYFQAVEDYVLRSSGPSAHGRDMEMDDYRTANDAEMEGLRFGNRSTLERIRQDNRQASERTRQGNRIELKRTPAPPRATAGRPTAKNARGETIYYDSGKKKWVDAQGRPVG